MVYFLLSKFAPSVASGGERIWSRRIYLEVKLRYVTFIMHFLGIDNTSQIKVKNTTCSAMKTRSQRNTEKTRN